MNVDGLPASVDAVSAGLRAAGYLPGESTALVAYLATRLGKPVLVEGPAGVGKTELAKAMASYLGRESVRLQCYEGLDEAKALYEWNYRKQLLRIQAEADGAGWSTVQDDIFGEEFLLARPLLSAINATTPVVLLIDEIDKTDQEFEAMLLELLSDFQITIPELGRIEASSQPVVLLTSNNSARGPRRRPSAAALYLWLDYPAAERELEIVRLHVPELAETIARRLIEVVGMVRDLDLKKPPSIAESIDWARALLLLGAQDLDSATFLETMSIIVKHRTDIEPARGARRARARVSIDAAPLVELGEEPRGEGVAVGTSELLDAARRRLAEIDWRERATFQAALASTLAKSPEDRRVFDIVFDRFFFRATEAAAIEAGIVETGASGGEGAADQIDLDALRAQIAQALADGDEARLRDLARLALAALGRSAEGSGVVGIDVQRIRRALGLRSDPQPDYPPGDPRREGLPREALRRFEAILRRELERAQIERAQALPPSRPLGDLDRALPSGPAADLAAVHRVVAQLRRRPREPRRRAARLASPRARRCQAHDARVAADRRRPGRQSTARAAPAARRSTSSATCRRASPRRRCTTSRCCTRCTTRFAGCARATSSSASPRSPTSSSGSAASRR